MSDAPREENPTDEDESRPIRLQKLLAEAEAGVNDASREENPENASKSSPIRLQKLLAEAGVGSRRYCETLISDGRISVDGVLVTKLGFSTYPGSDIKIDGMPLYTTGCDDPKKSHLYILLNKPAGIITSVKDQFGRKTVIDLLGGEISRRVFPVGRLDYDTTGLILLTDDGGFAYRVSHPKFGVEKAYDVICGNPPGAGEIDCMREGALLEGGFRSSPARVYTHSNDIRKLTIVLREGKNRQVRKMLESVGNSVLSLIRVAIGGVSIDGLTPGKWRRLSPEEADMVFQPYVHIK